MNNFFFLLFFFCLLFIYPSSLSARSSLTHVGIPHGIQPKAWKRGTWRGEECREGMVQSSQWRTRWGVAGQSPGRMYGWPMTIVSSVSWVSCIRIKFGALVSHVNPNSLGDFDQVGLPLWGSVSLLIKWRECNLKGLFQHWIPSIYVPPPDTLPSPLRLQWSQCDVTAWLFHQTLSSSRRSTMNRVLLAVASIALSIRLGIILLNEWMNEQSEGMKSSDSPRAEIWAHAELG